MTNNETTTINVNSTMIDTATYDHNSNMLLVRFKNTQAKYIYRDVPGFVFHGLFAAESKGKFIYKNIINGKFTYTRV